MNRATYSRRRASKALGMNCDGTLQTQAYYPGLGFRIRDEPVLVQDLTHSIQEAKTKLLEEKKDEKGL